MKIDLQKLRDAAEHRCFVAAEKGDRDSSDAWERIGIAIDECLRKTKHDFNLIEQRAGLFALRESGVDVLEYFPGGLASQ